MMNQLLKKLQVKFLLLTNIWGLGWDGAPNIWPELGQVTQNHDTKILSFSKKLVDDLGNKQKGLTLFSYLFIQQVERILPKQALNVITKSIHKNPKNVEIKRKFGMEFVMEL